MKLLLVCLLSITSVFASTHTSVTKKFRIDSRLDIGSRVFYNCDSVEDKAYQTLRELGATNIELNCKGGLDPIGRFHGEAFLTVSFDVQTDEQAGAFEDFKIRSHQSCHLYSSLFKNLKDAFTFKEVSKVRRCTSPRSRFIVSGKVLK